MKMIPAQLVTFYGERVVIVKNITLPENYDGNPYGNTVSFPIGSNQYLRVDPDTFTEEFDERDNDA